MYLFTRFAQKNSSKWRFLIMPILPYAFCIGVFSLTGIDSVVAFLLARSNQQRGESFTMKKNVKLQSFITIGMLSSISFLLMLFNFPIPPFPAFLEVDFSDMPALIAAITMGPVAGILVELFKNVLDWVFSGTPTGVPVGHIANFATGILFILPVSFVFNRFKTMTGLISGLVLGTVTMAIGMSFLNYVLILPMYTYFLGMEPVVGDSLYTMIVAGILPFNLIKGVLITFIMAFLFTTMRKWVDQQRAMYLSK